MTDDIHLRLQAFADGELGESEGRELEALTFKDESSKEQLDFIRQISAVLRNNEPAAELSMPSRVYMDGIRDGIAAESGIEDLTEAQVMSIQALVDGELSGQDRKLAQNLVASNAAARSLFAMIQTQNEVVAMAGDAPVACPESREFYWSGIERQIAGDQRISDSGTHSISWKSAVSWILNPVFAPAALVAVLCFLVGNQLEQPGIYETVEVSTAYVDQQAGFAVYYVDAPNFLSGALESSRFSKPTSSGAVRRE